MWGQKNGVSAADRGGESHNGGVPNTPAGVARQGKAGQGGEGRRRYWEILGRGSPGGGREINDGFLCMGCQTCIETYCCVPIQRGVEEWER